MKAFLAVLLFLFLINCGSSQKTEENPTVNKRGGMVELSKIDGCDKFYSAEDCVVAKEINTSLAYFLGSKKDTQVISISKLDPSSLPITKIKNSNQLDLYKNKIKDPDAKTSKPYLEQKDGKIPPITTQDLVEYIQDEQAGIPQGKSPGQVKEERIAFQLAEKERQQAEFARKAEEERQRILKEIAAFPYTIEIYCLSNVTDKIINMNECATKLRPSLSINIPKENRLYTSYTTLDFMDDSKINGRIKLPKDFTLLLNSEGLDSSTLFQIVLQERVPPGTEEPKPKLVIGQKFNINP